MKRIQSLLLTLCAVFSCSGVATASSHQEGYVPIKDGKIYYETFGKGDPIIVIHGGPGFDLDWFLPQMKTLAKDHEVILYDQRGSGKSVHGKIDASTINMPQFVADLEALRKKLGYEKVTLLGHSWGGLLAMNYAIAHPDHVSTLILADAAPSSAAGFKAFMAEAQKRVGPLEAKLKPIEDSKAFKEGDPKTSADFYHTLFQAYFYNPKNIDELDLQRTRESLVGGTKIFPLLAKDYLSNYNIRADLKNLKIPTLILHGDKDIVPLWTAHETQKAIPGSTLVVIKNADHFSYVEKPKEFFGAIEKFLKR